MRQSRQLTNLGPGRTIKIMRPRSLHIQTALSLAIAFGLSCVAPHPVCACSKQFRFAHNPSPKKVAHSCCATKSKSCEVASECSSCGSGCRCSGGGCGSKTSGSSGCGDDCQCELNSSPTLPVIPASVVQVDSPSSDSLCPTCLATDLLSYLSIQHSVEENQFIPKPPTQPLLCVWRN